LLSFTARRAAALVMLVVGITAVAFVLTHIVPGDPVASNLGESASANPAIVKAFKERYGLDKPLWQQYEIYMSNLIHGDLGTSQQTHHPVARDLGEYIPATAELGLTSSLIALLLGIPLGLLAAMRANTAADQALRLVSLSGLSVPVFWLALMSLYVFYLKLDWLPVGGRLDPGMVPPSHLTGLYTVDALLAGDVNTFLNAAYHLALPAAVLSAYNIGLLTRFTRSAALEVIGEEYITAARAKGLPTLTIATRHVLVAALPPIITITGLGVANVITGATLIETIFSWPGLGQYAFRSAVSLDVPSIMGVSMFVALVYVTVNFGVDVLHMLVDPRLHPQ
jgi:peptide/nickel transport system permease protein